MTTLLMKIRNNEESINGETLKKHFRYQNPSLLDLLKVNQVRNN